MIIITPRFSYCISIHSIHIFTVHYQPTSSVIPLFLGERAPLLLNPWCHVVWWRSHEFNLGVSGLRFPSMSARTGSRPMQRIARLKLKKLEINKRIKLNLLWFGRDHFFSTSVSL